MIQLRSIRSSLLPIGAACLLGLTCTPPLMALLEMAEGEVFLSLDASVSTDSNVGNNALEESDTIYAVTPGISWERSRGRASVAFSASYEIERAATLSTYDSENFSTNFTLDVPATTSGRLQGSLNAGYFDGSRINSLENTRQSESSWNCDVNGTYQLTQKIGLRSSAGLTRTEPDTRAAYEDVHYGLGLGYLWRPAVTLFVDGTQNESNSDLDAVVSGRSDTSGTSVVGGISGQLTRHLSGSFGLGYLWNESELIQRRNIDLDPELEEVPISVDSNGLTYNASLTWSPREPTSVSLTATKGVTSGSSGAAENSTIALNLTQAIGSGVSVNAGLSRREVDFALSERGDDETNQLNLGLRYTLRREVSFGLTYTYSDTDSTNSERVSTRSLWRLSASARF